MSDTGWKLIARHPKREYYVNEDGMCRTVDTFSGKETVNDGLLVRGRSSSRLCFLGQPVARLVAAAFLNPPKDKKWIAYRKKDDPFDNSVSNIRLKIVGEGNVRPPRRNTGA